MDTCLAKAFFNCYSQEELDSLVQRYKSSRLPIIPDFPLKYLQDYLEKWDIEAVVVGVSGGVDSAVVATLLTEVKRPVEVHCLNITYPIFDKVYEPKFAYLANLDLAKRGARVHSIRISDNLKPTPETSDEALADIAYQHRYQQLFAYNRSLNKRSLVVGTANFDELAFAGWFGKSSDMMVDIQPIWWLHKFEVLELAKQLGVPNEIINRTPTGDLLSGNSDEECFGVSYDELSLLSIACSHVRLLLLDNTSQSAWHQKHFEKVYALRKRNAFKYQKPFWNHNPIFLGMT